MKAFVEQFICVSKWKRWAVEEMRTEVETQRNDDDRGGNEENVLSVLAGVQRANHELFNRCDRLNERWECKQISGDT